MKGAREAVKLWLISRRNSMARPLELDQKANEQEHARAQSHLSMRCRVVAGCLPVALERCGLPTYQRGGSEGAKPWAPPSCFRSFSVCYNAFYGPIRNKMAAQCLLLSSLSRPLDLAKVKLGRILSQVWLSGRCHASGDKESTQNKSPRTRLKTRHFKIAEKKRVLNPTAQSFWSEIKLKRNSKDFSHKNTQF